MSRVPGIEQLLANNRIWAEQVEREKPGFFAHLAQQQSPGYMWIGCADSRVPANEIIGLEPGEVFVHRNVANVVHSSDMNLLASLEFAVEALKVREIIICGHHGCGGVKAATEDIPHGLTEHWIEPIRRLARSYAVDLAREPGPEARLDRLAELNVAEGVRRVCETPILQRAWRRGAPIRVHGLIYGLKDGRLRNLDCSMGPGHFQCDEAS